MKPKKSPQNFRLFEAQLANYEITVGVADDAACKSKADDVWLDEVARYLVPYQGVKLSRNDASPACSAISLIMRKHGMTLIHPCALGAEIK